jgi:hypothetical protein
LSGEPPAGVGPTMMNVVADRHSEPGLTSPSQTRRRS